MYLGVGIVCLRAVRINSSDCIFYSRLSLNRLFIANSCMRLRPQQKIAISFRKFVCLCLLHYRLHSLKWLLFSKLRQVGRKVLTTIQLLYTISTKEQKSFIYKGGKLKIFSFPFNFQRQMKRLISILITRFLCSTRYSRVQKCITNIEFIQYMYILHRAHTQPYSPSSNR